MTTRAGFGPRLRVAMDRFGPLCVGIDPHPDLLAAWGLPVDAMGLRTFAAACVDAFAGEVAVVKPQSAFFEEHGSAGIAALEDLLEAFRGSGTLTLLDVKRGDIGTTMAGYARAYLGDDSSLRADAITVSPFLGFGSLRPALDLAAATGRGVFVLALTSNPEGQEVQHARNRGVTVAQHIVERVAAANSESRSRGELGSVGLVIGATTGSAAGEMGLDLGGSSAPLLAPGLGAQGAGVDELRATFGDALPNVLASSSREILGAGPHTKGLRAAVRATAALLAG